MSASRATWPTAPLARVPRASGAATLATRVREMVGAGTSPLQDLDAVCEAAGVGVDEAELGGARGQLEALLIPTTEDRFSVVVDPTPRGGWEGVPDAHQDAVRRHRLRFRVGHELGHTFFYWRGRDRPERHLFDSDAQERFCDDFARALLVPPEVAAQVPLTADAVLALHEEFDVSLQVAARAVAGAQPAAVGLWFGESPTTLTRQWTTPGLGTKPPEAGEANGRWLSERRQHLHVAHAEA